MARRAKFGQTPRVQPSLTSTLISIAREMVAREDANIMDAWRYGGEFEGSKVTDKEVLAYWRKRDDGLDKDDPAYDTIQNQIFQLRYGIEQSEMDLKHLQGKISHREFANFYLRWAKKAPRHSEFWRTLQKDAAQLIEQQKNESRVSAESARAEAFNKYQNNQWENNIAIGDALSAAMVKMAQEVYGENVGAALTDHGDELLALVTEDFKNHPNDYGALTQALKTGDPNFSGTFDKQYFTNAMNRATRGYEHIATRAKKEGYADNFASASASQSKMNSFAVNTKAWDVATAYERAYDKAMVTVNDPNASARDKAQAWATFGATAGQLAQTTGIDTDIKTLLQADADRALGKDVDDTGSFGAAYLGVSHPGVSLEQGQQIKAWNEAEAKIAAQPDKWEYAPTTPDGHFDPTGKGPIGVVDQNEVPNTAVMVPVAGLDGKPVMVSVVPTTVYMEDPNNPSTPNSQNGLAVGRAITYSVGGQQVTLYETATSDGVTRWQRTNPFNGDLKSTTDDNGNIHLVADKTPATEAQRATEVYNQAKALDAEHGTNIADSIVTKDANGNITGLVQGSASSFDKTGGAAFGSAGQTTVKYDSDTGFVVSKGATLFGDQSSAGGALNEEIPFVGQRSSDQWLWDTAHDQTRYQAGEQPGITFNSAMGAGTDAFRSTLSLGQLKVLVTDDAFVHAFIQQESEALGVTDPLNDTRAWDSFYQFKTKVEALDSIQFAGGVSIGGVLFGGGIVAKNGATRTDLSYPGGTARGHGEAETGPGITFGGQSIKVPAIPKIGAPSSPEAPVGAGGLMPGAWKNQVLQPGQQIGTPLVSTTTTPATTTPTTTQVNTTPTATAPAPTPGGGGSNDQPVNQYGGGKRKK